MLSGRVQIELYSLPNTFPRKGLTIYVVKRVLKIIVIVFSGSVSFMLYFLLDSSLFANDANLGKKRSKYATFSP